jgi:hypothetical protein
MVEDHLAVVVLDVLVEARPGAARLNNDAKVAFRLPNGSRRRSSPFSSIR